MREKRDEWKQTAEKLMEELDVERERRIHAEFQLNRALTPPPDRAELVKRCTVDAEYYEMLSDGDERTHAEQTAILLREAADALAAPSDTAELLSALTRIADIDADIHTERECYAALTVASQTASAALNKFKGRNRNE